LKCKEGNLEKGIESKNTYLREEVMKHMGANVMMDLVEDAIVSVNSRQASPQVTPLLQSTPQTLIICRKALLDNPRLTFCKAG